LTFSRSFFFLCLSFSFHTVLESSSSEQISPSNSFKGVSATSSFLQGLFFCCVSYVYRLPSCHLWST
jgi:hypothetical protein